MMIIFYIKNIYILYKTIYYLGKNNEEVFERILKCYSLLMPLYLFEIILSYIIKEYIYNIVLIWIYFWLYFKDFKYSELLFNIIYFKLKENDITYLQNLNSEFFSKILKIMKKNKFFKIIYKYFKEYKHFLKIK